MNCSSFQSWEIIRVSNCSCWSPSSTHLCHPEDIFHSCGPRLCPPCSSRSPGWGRSAPRARSPWPRTPSGSTAPARLETLTEEGLNRVWFWWLISTTQFNVIGVGALLKTDLEGALTHQRIGACPAPNQPYRNIWSCPVCSGSLHSDRRPAWSTRWCLQVQEVGWKIKNDIVSHLSYGNCNYIKTR